MPFKIVSTVSINASPVGVEPVSHVVLRRERQLHPGETIAIRGSITYDVETKGPWIGAKGKIRVIDNETVGIRWRSAFVEGLIHGFIESEAAGIVSRAGVAGESLRWSEERIIKASGQETTVDLARYDSYPALPEIFSPLDRLKIGPLTEKAMKSIEGIKSVERKTELVYEP